MATLGCENLSTGHQIKQLFETDSLSIEVAKGASLVELTSVLSTICGLCGGFADALDVDEKCQSKSYVPT